MKTIIRVVLISLLILNTGIAFSEIFKVEQSKKYGAVYTKAVGIKPYTIKQEKGCLYVDEKDLPDQKYQKAWKIDGDKIVIDESIKAEIDEELNKPTLEDRIKALEDAK